ncbi:hypothetical protein BV20DRAFT_334834 [Pilatotrama ljubarskyi]|nr:hypothetical protein BV20DRAFT_334834 [Pilatotrama ljubarskyi]
MPTMHITDRGVRACPRLRRRREKSAYDLGTLSLGHGKTSIVGCLAPHQAQVLGCIFTSPYVHLRAVPRSITFVRGMTPGYCCRSHSLVQRASDAQADASGYRDRQGRWPVTLCAISQREGSAGRTSFSGHS